MCVWGGVGRGVGRSMHIYMYERRADIKTDREKQNNGERKRWRQTGRQTVGKRQRAITVPLKS